MTDKDPSTSDNPKRRRNRKRAIPVPIRQAILGLVVDDGMRNKAEIYRELGRREELSHLRLPAERTIGREVDDVIREFVTGDDTGAWSPADHEVGSPAVLEALAGIIERTRGRISSLTVADARRIVRLARLLPDVAPLALWRISRLYAARGAKNASTTDLDAYLAFGPWRSDAAEDRYLSAVGDTGVRYVEELDVALLPGDHSPDAP